MAVKDVSKTSFVQDNDELVFIGIDLPFRKSDGVDGWFASTNKTIDAVKNNIRNLLRTEKGERLYQPNFGLNLKKHLFEPFTPETKMSIQSDIGSTISTFLPFVEIQELKISMREDSKALRGVIEIFVLFNILNQPNALNSVQVTIGGE
jgi:phage baseplate assembly protein W